MSPVDRANDTRVVIAAPLMPSVGINAAFKPRLAIAATHLIVESCPLLPVNHSPTWNTLSEQKKTIAASRIGSTVCAGRYEGAAMITTISRESTARPSATAIKAARRYVATFEYTSFAFGWLRISKRYECHT